MNRMDGDERLADMLRNNRPAVPAQVHEGIERRLASLPERNGMPKRRGEPKRRIMRTWVAAATGIMLLAGAMLLFNGTSSFAATLKEKLHSIFVDSGDPALMVEGSKDELGILFEKTDHDYTIRVHEAMFDGQRLSLSYSLSHPGGIPKSLWVRPAFQLDAAMKQMFPGIVGTDGGGIQGDSKIGVVNYYFLGSTQAPDKLKLNIDVKGIAIFEDPAKQRLLSGDWSFQLPVEKKGEPVRNVAAAKLPAVIDEDVHFAVKQVRTASRSTLWRFYWTYPSSLQPNVPGKGTPKYDVRYQITAAGKEMTAALDYKSGGRLKKDGQVVNGMSYEDDTLVTEQLPEDATEVTITPILRTWNANGSSGYKETPLKAFVVRVPVE
ncbi:DUF4179 domain-containing protein [Paenibacillus rhizovicinus]|uniref:DUF4179 domain-containing protein n=1 Tax=Paenibacillus rhizovicinus TaxID=2704463 RepID=A0A6C0NXU5_9BACL|nr:DUF4179 domain-containing protein [Paenibacillus rhizovicinus]QHW31050.1 DUF4179 domain-containing protein [Paenibacillus rhizovicinus]